MDRVRLYTVNGKAVSVFDDKNGNRYMLNQAGRVTPFPHRLPTPKVTIKDLGAKVSEYTKLLKATDGPYVPELAEWEGYFYNKYLHRETSEMERHTGLSRDALADEVSNRIRCPQRLAYIYDALLS